MSNTEKKLNSACDQDLARMIAMERFRTMQDQIDDLVKDFAELDDEGAAEAK
jgi:hypothetical protein